jgi:hypothetical protein
MTDKERIIIDGVDVSECEQITYKKSLNPMCGNTWFCCYGRENCYFKQLARKTQECEELKERLKTQIDLSIRYVPEKVLNRYRKVLEDIEVVINNLEKQDILTFPDFSLQENYKIIMKQCNEGYRQILNLISKAKGEEND